MLYVVLTRDTRTSHDPMAPCFALAFIVIPNLLCSTSHWPLHRRYRTLPHGRDHRDAAHHPGSPPDPPTGSDSDDMRPSGTRSSPPTKPIPRTAHLSTPACRRSRRSN